MKANLTIKTGKNIPKLGLTTSPSTYVIIKVDDKQQVTSIYPNSCNPTWNYITEIQNQFQLERVSFYVFNSNTNHIDQLLAIGYTQYENFLTIVPTGSRIMLYDSTGSPLASWLQIQHYNANPPTNPQPPLNQRTTIRINLLGITANNQRSNQWIDQYKDKHVTIQYGSQIKQFSDRLSVNTFRFDGSQPEIFVRLQLEQKIKLSGSILFENITQNCSLRVKLYYGNHQIIVLLGASIIQNGLLPQNHNTLLVQITQLIIQPIKKIPKDWSIIIYGIYGRQIINKIKQPCRLYIENNTELQFQYFEQNINENNMLDLESIASHLIPVNSINWAITLNSVENVKMYNPARGIVINVGLRFTIVKNQKDSALLPKFQKTSLNMFGDKNVFKVSQIKMVGACLSEIFTEKTTFFFVWVPNFGHKTIFPSFQIKSSIEYNIPCRQNVYDSQGGQLLLVTFDHYFGKEQQNENQLQNYIIFKVIGKDLQDLVQAPIIFHQRFLSYAKKQSLAKNCKKFDTMIRDKTLSLKVMGKRCPLFQPGLLTVHNCMMEGGQVRVNLSIVFDSNELTLQGEWNDNLMTKPYIVNVRDSGIQFKVTEKGITSQIHYEFEEVFGAPDEKKVYTTTVSLPLQRKLTIIYSFTEFQPPTLPKSALKILRFKSSTPLHIKIKSALVPYEGFSEFKLRVAKSSTTYQTLQENPSSSLIRFRDCEDMYFENSDQNNYLFFNLYCKNKQGALVIYAGHYNSKNIIGKGSYQLVLIQIGNQEKKNSVALTFQVLNDTPLDQPAVKLSPKMLKFSPEDYMKTIMKYYLVSEINNNPIGIFDLAKLDNGLVTNQSIMVQNREDVVWRLYSSLGQLSKEGFWSSQKELIASSKLLWSEVNTNGLFLLRFLPAKELHSKLSANKLALLQNMVKVKLEYTCQPQPQTELILQNKIPKPLDIEVLHNAACKLTILQIQPYCSHQKILQLILQPLQFDFRSQSRYSLNKQFIVQLENMKMKLSIIKSSKIKQKYNKEIVQKEISFRGKRIKTMEKIGFVVDFQGICLIKAHAVILSSKFTSNCRGVLKLLTVGCNNSKIKQIQIYPLKSQSQLKQNLQKQTPIKIPMTQKQSKIKVQLQINQITFCLYFIITYEDKSRVKSLVHLADVPMDRLDQKPFSYQWIVLSSKSRDLIWFQGQYRANKVDVVEGQAVPYQLQVDNKIVVVTREFKTKQKIGMLKQLNKLDVYRPDRKRGYRIVANVPETITATSVTAILPDKSSITLTKSQHNLNTYMHTSAQNLKVQSLSINSPQTTRIEQLEQKNFTRRFLINRDPSKIVLLQQEPYAIADSKPQSIIINFYFHEIYSNDINGKIMWMQNNKFDEILTRNFGLLVKHGKQKKIIRKINQNGEFQSIIQGSLNEQGGSLIERRRVRFGFQALSDELEIFLFISHALNQKQSAEALQCENIQNWTKLFPVAYGKINLQKINQKSLVGCELKKISNSNPTLDKPLNNVIVRPNLNCLGSIYIQKKRWGLIYLQLEEVSTIQLQFSAENTLIYFTLEIQNSRRNKIAGFVTQARNFNKKSRLKFINNKCSFFYIENKDEGESLKITATLLTFNNSFKLFQKRIDLTQYLNQPSNHSIATQLKPVQTKGLKSTLQIKLNLLNTSSPKQAQNLVEQANKINTVDMINYQNYAQNQMIQKLIRCQQPSHLLQVFSQVKESVIYSKQSQIQLFKTCGYYLQCQSDTKLILVLLEMMNIEIFKYPNILQKLSQSEIKRIYTYIKILFESRQVQLPKVEKKMSASTYTQSTKKINMTNLDQAIKAQKKQLYTSQQLIQPSSLALLEHLLPVMEAFLSKSSTFKQLFKKEINQWSDAMMFKEDIIFIRYLIMLGEAYGDKGMDAELAQDVLKRGLKKVIPMQPLIEVWAKLPKEKLAIYTLQIFNKIVKKFDSTKESQESVQSLRVLINYANMFKLEISDENWKLAVNRSLDLIKESKDFFIINIYSELLIKLNSIAKISEQKKVQIVGQIKKRLSTQNDKNIKLCLNNLVDKLCGKKVVTVQQATAAKAQFYKKYLITS